VPSRYAHPERRVACAPAATSTPAGCGPGPDADVDELGDERDYPDD